MARRHCSINAFMLVLIAALIAGMAGACENTARGMKEDAAEAEAETRDERAQAREAAGRAADEARDAARAAGRAAAQAGEELAERAGAAAETIDVKAALMADPSVDATRIDVDVDSRRRTVTLDGYVPTENERTRAESVAREEAPGYKVVNDIEVSPRIDNDN